jgi:hypothetical protein
MVAHPSGVLCRSLVARRTWVDPAHCTPLGCGSRKDHVSINITPLRGASQTKAYATLLFCGPMLLRLYFQLR